MRTYEVMVCVPKGETILFEETSSLPYWVALIAIQKRNKKKYTKELGVLGINVFVKRHPNDLQL